MRIIGVDPGSRFTGFGVIDAQGNQLHCVAQGFIDSTKGEMPERLATLQRRLADVVAEYSPESGAVESAFVHRNAQSALKLGQARGVVLAVLSAAGVKVAEYAPREVKLSVVGYGNAEKTQVQHMICQLLALREKPQEDAADALAIAVCHQHRAAMADKLARAGVWQ